MRPEEKPPAIGLPGKIGRWSPEQRAAAMQRQKIMRFLMEDALVGWKDIMVEYERQFGVQVNPWLDAFAAGWAGRPWLVHTAVWEGVGYRSDYAKYREVRSLRHDEMPKPPKTSKRAVAVWLFTHSTMSATEITDALDIHVSVTSRRGKPIFRHRLDSVDAIATTVADPHRRGRPPGGPRRPVYEPKGERIICGRCGRWVVVNPAGTLRRHRDSAGKGCPQRNVVSEGTVAAAFLGDLFRRQPT